MIVMKFGGTSVEDASAIRRLQQIVSHRLEQRPVVVVSALAKVTDALLQSAAFAALGDESNTFAVFGSLARRHEETIREVLPRPQATLAGTRELFGELRHVLEAVCALREVTPRLSDRIVSYGERLSSAIVAAALQQAGVKAELIDARECIRTNDHYTAAAPLIDETNGRLQSRLWPLLSEGKVPVMGGFIASDGKGHTTTLGRGGSDFTAALVGAALDALRVDIWTDVDGIRTTDPRLYPQAKAIETLSFQEAAELAHFGAKVLHPATLLPAIERNIPVYVLNSHNPEHPGTRVQAQSDGPARIKAIAVKRGILLLRASMPRSPRRNGLALDVFSALEQQGCRPDVASVSDANVLVTVDRKELVPLICNSLGPQVEIHAENSKALISLVAEGIRTIPDLPTRVFAALEGLEVRLIAQGASHLSFSLVVEEKDVAEALRRLHGAVLEYEPEAALVAG